MRKILDLPKNFQDLEIEFQKKLKQFWFQTREKLGPEGSYSEETEALLFLMLEKLENTVMNEKISSGERLLDRHSGEEFKILLPTYGKKVTYNREANWIIPENMDEQDWYESIMESNKRRIS